MLIKHSTQSYTIHLLCNVVVHDVTMKDVNVDDLMAELRELKIRVARLEGVSEESVMKPAVRDGDAEAGDRLRTVRIINPATRVFKVGDRVQIKNKVRKPSNWPREVQWSEELERTATVTRVTPRQVHFITDNGTQTRRPPNSIQYGWMPGYRLSYVHDDGCFRCWSTFTRISWSLCTRSLGKG